MKSRTEGIVIYKQKIRDAMWLVKVMTLDQGLQSFWHRPKKGTRPLNALQEISFISVGDQREQLHWMKELEITVPHHHIESHPVKQPPHYSYRKFYIACCKKMIPILHCSISSKRSWSN